MHPRNKIRLMAGIKIDPLLEKKDYSKDMKGKKKGDYPGKVDGPNGKALKEEGMGAPNPAGVSEVNPVPRASEQTSTIADNYQDGDLMFYNNGIFIVVLADAKTDMIGIIPAGLINASAAEKNRAVEMVKPDAEKCRKPTREEIDAFKASEEELAAVDDDMDVQFGGEAQSTNEWIDPQAAARGGEAYKRAHGGPDNLTPPAKPRRKLRRRKTPLMRGGEQEENYYADDEDLSDVEQDPAVAAATSGEVDYAGAYDDDALNDYDDVAGQGRGIARNDSAEKFSAKDPSINNEITPEDLAALNIKPNELAAFIKRFRKGEEEYSKYAAMGESASTLGGRIKAKRLGESTHNYAPGNKMSHEDVVSDPINVVRQDTKSWANSLDPKVVKNEYTLQPENRGDESMTEESEKVKVPSAIKEALKTAIAEFKRDAELQGAGHTARENAEMMMNTALAFQTILDHLNEGSVMGVKEAQIFAQTLMGPMLHKIPDNVWDFITNGGQKRSLKDYMLKVD